MILGQHHAQLSEPALNDFFLKSSCYPKQCKYAMKLGVAQIRGVHLVQMGLNSSNLAIRVGMKNISRKGGVGLKGGLL